MSKSLLLLCLATAFAGQAFAEAPQVETKPRLKIGFVGALSGPARGFGEAVKNGIVLALEDQGDGTVQAVFEDDEYQSGKTISGFRKLTEADKVDVVFTVASGPSNAVAPLAEEKGVLMIAWASDPHVSQGRPHVFRSWISGQREGARAAEEAQKRGLSRVALYTVESDYAVSVRDGFLAAALPEHLVDKVEVAPDLTDFRSLLSRTRAARPDSIYICLAPSQMASLAKQVRQLGMKAVFGGCEALFNEDEVRSAGGALQGAWLITASARDDFRSRYIKRFGNDNSVSGAAIHYDITNLLHELAASGETRDKLPLALEHAGSRSGAIGSYTVRNADGDRYFDLSLTVKEITPQGFTDAPSGSTAAHSGSSFSE